MIINVIYRQCEDGLISSELQVLRADHNRDVTTVLTIITIITIAVKFQLKDGVFSPEKSDMRDGMNEVALKKLWIESNESTPSGRSDVRG